MVPFNGISACDGTYYVVKWFLSQWFKYLPYLLVLHLTFCLLLCIYLLQFFLHSSLRSWTQNMAGSRCSSFTWVSFVSTRDTRAIQVWLIVEGDWIYLKFFSYFRLGTVHASKSTGRLSIAKHKFCIMFSGRFKILNFWKVYKKLMSDFAWKKSF